MMLVRSEHVSNQGTSRSTCLKIAQVIITFSNMLAHEVCEVFYERK